MATLLHSPHRVRPDEPNQFRERRQVWLQLQYMLDANDEPKFSYRIETGRPEEENLLPGRVEQAAWSAFMKREDLVADLDIRITKDSLVTVETFGNGLLWSLGVDAIMTREPRTTLYGELRYWNGGQWQTREDFDQASCRRIRFKAKKSAAANEESHKFSYNVIYRTRDGNMQEFEIDPDIKNPSV